MQICLFLINEKLLSVGKGSVHPWIPWCSFVSKGAFIYMQGRFEPFAYHGQSFYMIAVLVSDKDVRDLVKRASKRSQRIVNCLTAPSGVNEKLQISDLEPSAVSR